MKENAREEGPRHFLDMNRLTWLARMFVQEISVR